MDTHGNRKKSLVVAEDLTCPELVEGLEPADLWEPFARSDSSIRDIASATDPRAMGPCDSAFVMFVQMGELPVSVENHDELCWCIDRIDGVRSHS